MKTKYSYKQIWTISYPILISLIMEQMIGMTDTAFLGRVGEIELGASAIAGVYYLAIFMMAFGFSIGAQILIARRNGEGNYKEIGPIFYQGIYFLLAMAVILFTFSIVFSPYILKNIISSPHIYDAAESYIHWRVYGFFLTMIAQASAATMAITLIMCANGWISLELGTFECGIQLYPDFRKIRFPAIGNCRCCYRLFAG